MSLWLHRYAHVRIHEGGLERGTVPRYEWVAVEQAAEMFKKVHRRPMAIWEEGAGPRATGLVMLLDKGLPIKEPGSTLGKRGCPSQSLLPRDFLNSCVRDYP